jgi:ribonucleoside-diphosphate reductase alpha chain
MSVISMTHTESNAALSTQNVPMQDASLDIWEKKYRLVDARGNPVDLSLEDTRKRIARSLAESEKPADRTYWEERFAWALENGAIPAGRITANAGAQAHKSAVSLINCTVSETIGDSMREILERNTDAGLTLKSGAGIGYCFSTLRHKGAHVAGAGASTNGPMAFMDIFDRMCFTVSSAGGRRGAQMGTFDVGHPDVEEFIHAKREDGRLRQFNLSLLITEDFVEAVKADEDWPLAFPVKTEEFGELAEEDVLYRPWAVKDPDYVYADDGLVACKIERRVRARDLWHQIMQSTYDYAEPGFILIDRVNEMNNNWFCESIQATNPCGEQPLPPGGSCLLGSVNLTRFVIDPFGESPRFDWERFEAVVNVFSRMLDNVVEQAGLPLDVQRQEIERKRRHGMGFLGLGSTLTMLKTPYGTAESVDFTDEVSKRLALVGWRAALDLAKEKGPAPILDEEFTITPEMIRLRPELEAHGYAVGDRVPGRVLHAKYSRYMQQVAEEDPALVEELARVGARYTHHSSIAPTGTISLSIGNNASNGIEPSFAHRYFRNVIREGKATKEKVEVTSFELEAYRTFVQPGATEDDLPEYFVTTDDIAPRDHVAVQAAAQKWVDSSISKTVNVPTDFPYEDFQNLYLEAYEKGLKGCTTFRFNPEAFQGVLVREDDLKNTTYQFTLDSGEVVELQGDEEVEYEGQTHTAANLYDAIKEGTYGRW